MDRSVETLSTKATQLDEITAILQSIEEQIRETTQLDEIVTAVQSIEEQIQETMQLDEVVVTLVGIQEQIRKASQLDGIAATLESIKEQTQKASQLDEIAATLRGIEEQIRKESTRNESLNPAIIEVSVGIGALAAATMVFITGSQSGIELAHQPGLKVAAWLALGTSTLATFCLLLLYLLSSRGYGGPQGIRLWWQFGLGVMLLASVFLYATWILWALL